MPGLEIVQIFIKHTANAATKVLTFLPWENRPSKWPKSYERYFYIFISAMCERIWKGELKQFWVLRRKEAKCIEIWETKTMGKYLKLWELVKLKKIVGIEEIIENVLRTFFLIVKIKDVRKRSPHHYCCIMHGWHYISMHNSLNIFWFCQKLSWRGGGAIVYEHIF